MELNKNNETEGLENESSDEITGARIGFAVVTVMALCIIIGLMLPVFCPHTYDWLKSIAETVMDVDDD